MKKIFTSKRIRYALFIFSTAYFAGCNKAAIQFGQNYIDVNNTNIVLVDSMTVGVSTVYKDSVPTAQTNTVLLGVTTDPYFGKTTATSYLSLVPASNTPPDFLPNAGYDSLVLLMKSNKDYYGDTTTIPTYNVRQLATEIVLPDDQFTFYNTSSFPVNPTVLGTRTLGIRPSNADSVNIKMSNTLGTTLFGMLRRKSDTVKINSAFTKFFKGLQLSSVNANVIYGFKDSVVLRMYYHETDNYFQTRSFDFVLNNSNFQFNNIAPDRTGTNINSTVLGPTQKEVASTLTANLGYSQSASGLYLKISFPTLRNLLQRPDYTKIISAQLIVKPVPSGYSGLFALPPQLVAATTDVLNQPGGVLTTTSGGSAVTETGNLNIDYLNANNTSYSYDVTNYLVSQIGLVGNFQNGLLLIPPSNTRYSTLQRLVMGDSKNPNTNARIQLKVYYISVTR